MAKIITDPIIDELKQFDTDTNRLLYQYGVAHTQYDVVKKQFESELSMVSIDIQSKMNEFDDNVKSLKEKYGDGHLDLMKGNYILVEDIDEISKK